MPISLKRSRRRSSKRSRRSKKSRSRRSSKGSRSRRSKRSRSRRSSKRSRSRRSSKRSRSRRRSSKSRSRRRSSKSRSRRRSSKGSQKEYPRIFKGKKNDINAYFEKIFIVNLLDKVDRFNKVVPRFINQGIKYEIFTAIDGRSDIKNYAKKKKELESKYKVKISRNLNPPAASLVIGTIEILKKIVKNKWKRVLICEDDVIPIKNIHKRFEEGIIELEEHTPDWDLLYLGCGNQCGYRGVSYDQTYKTKHMTSLSIVDKDEYNWYVGNKNDLRMPCDEDYCEKKSKNLSEAPSPGGTWAYAYSYKGAKKLLKLIDGKVSDHIDQIIMKLTDKGLIRAVAFDPPLYNHEGGMLRADSSIPWML